MTYKIAQIMKIIHTIIIDLSYHKSKSFVNRPTSPQTQSNQTISNIKFFSPLFYCQRFTLESMKFFFMWSKYRFFNIPTFVYSAFEQPIIYIKNLYPFSSRVFLSSKFSKNILSRILPLFKQRCPSAIFFAIIPIIVNSINRSIFYSKFFYMKFIRFIHIISKIFKRFPKTFYSSRSIHIILRAIRILTSHFKPYISIIKTTRMMLARKSVSSGTNINSFSATHTTTRDYSFISKVSTSNYVITSTIAFTKKLKITPLTLSCQRYHQQITKSLTNQINSFHSFFTRKGDTLRRMSPSLVLS